jgi:hypothetical protein
VTTTPPLQNILQEILHTESETPHNHERAGSTKLQEKKKQEGRQYQTTGKEKARR